MFIDIIPLQKNTARLTRVYGDAPCAALPASVPGPEGGVLAITELGGLLLLREAQKPARGRCALPL